MEFIFTMGKENSSMGKNLLINIITRTSGRPNYFNVCRSSITQQTYKNINHIISVDDNESEEYIKKQSLPYIRLKKIPKDNYEPKSFWYHKNADKDRVATYNLYFNEIYQHIEDGWIMFIDDDNMLNFNNSIEYISHYLKSPDHLVSWRAQFPGYTIPRQGTKISLTSPPTPGNIAGQSFIFHKKWIKKAQWDYLGGGDFRVFHSLFNTIPNYIFLDNVLTKVQSQPNHGNRQDLKL